MAAKFGVVSHPQVRECGVTARQQSRLVDQGVWSPYAPSVIRDAAREDSWEMHAMAATLAPGAGAVLAGATAARLHGLDGFAVVERIIVMIPDRARVRVRADVTVVRAKRIDARDLTMVRGIASLDVGATQLVPASGHRDAEASWHRSGRRVAGARRTRHAAGRARSCRRRSEGRGRMPELGMAQHAEGATCRRGSQTALRSLGWDVVDLWWSDLERSDTVIDDVLLAIRKAERLKESQW